MRWALSAAVCLLVANASAQPLNLSNHTARPILILTEDHACDNTVQGPSVAPKAGCSIFANDPAAIYDDPTNDYFGELSYVGTSTLGTNGWLITVPQPVWQKILTIVLASSGGTLSTNTDFEILFDSGSGLVAPNPNSAAAPNYWSATASISGVPLDLVGNPDPSDYPFFGTPANPAPPPPLGPPLVLSCAWDKTNTSILGPGNPGSTVCQTPISQPGFALSGPLANTAMTFFSYTTIVIPGATEALTDAVWSAFSWQLNEAVDTDGDTIPDQDDNCQFTANIDQKDSGGVEVGSPPDGIGDACQCGDVNNDGFVTGIDAILIERAVAGLNNPPGVTNLPGYQKCDVNGSDTCDGIDATIIQRAMIGLGPGIKQLCPAAVCHSPEVLNGVTCPVLY
jgi:hypothetical protein